MNFCKLPPDRLCASAPLPPQRTSNALDAAVGERAHGFRVDPAAAHHLFAMTGEQCVFRQRHGRHRAAAEPLFGHEGEAERAPSARAVARGGLAARW